MKTLSFAVDKIELIEEVNKSQFAKVKLWAFASGDNLHELPVSEETLINRADTIYDKPLVWIYDSNTDDIGGHHQEEVPCGFVHRENNEIKFERTEDDRLFLTVEAMIWKKYSGDILDYFERDGNEKPVSVEIQILDFEEREDGKTEITDYCYMAITILGSKVSPAIPLAKAEIIQFSKDKEECEKILTNFSVNENQDTNIPEKEDESMAFSREEFATKFSMTANTMWSLLQDACSKVKYGENEWSKYWMTDYDSEYLYCYDEEDGGKVALPYSIADSQCNIDFENAKPCKSITQWVILEEKEEIENDPMMEMAKAMSAKEQKMTKEETKEEEEDKKDEEFAKDKEEKVDEETKEDDKEKDFSADLETIKTELEEMKTKFSTLEEENKTLKEDNEQLKTFKAETEEEKKMNRVEFAISEVIEFMPQEKIDELKEDAKNFSLEDLNVWENKVKSEAFDYSKGKVKNNKKGFALPYSTEQKDEKKSDSVWGRI